MEKCIDLYLISGFLGSGKTTFLQRLLTMHPEKKTGVIVNEFGDIGIDGLVVERNGIKMVEINHEMCIRDSMWIRPLPSPGSWESSRTWTSA